MTQIGVLMHHYSLAICETAVRVDARSGAASRARDVWMRDVAVFGLNACDEFPVLEVAGPLVHADAEAFRVALDEVADGSRGADVIVDLSGLEFICSAGMRLLVQYERALTDKGGRMVTTGLSGTARETIEMSGIFALLTTAPSVGAAIRQLQAA